MNQLTRLIRENQNSTPSKLHILVVTLDDEAVGTHSVSELEEGHAAVFHAHFWSATARGIGLGTYSYPRAARIFMERFRLSELIFKTPCNNVAANRIKAKLGLACVGTEMITYDFMLPDEAANVYKLSRQDLSRLLGA